MGCTTSHDALAAAAAAAASAPRVRRPSFASSSRRAARRGADPPAVCRERAALIRAAADRRFALAAAHAAYFRSLAAVGGALRRFAAAALLPAATPPLGSSPVLTLPRSPAKPVASSSAAAAATASLPPSPSFSSSTVSPLSHSLDDDDDDDLEPLADARHAGGHGTGPPPPSKAASSSRHHHHYMRNSGTVPTVVYEDLYAEYTEGETSYGYGYTYPYGPSGEVAADERPETVARGPPPSPPAAETSPWDFFDPFPPYDQFLEDYSRTNRNLPTSSPNYAEMRRMEGIPDLEDEAELAAEAEASKPSTSGIADQNVKGKGPVPTNAGSKGESSDGKLQRKGSGANGDAEKPVSRNDSVPSNASSKSRKGEKNNTASLKGTSNTPSLKGTDGGDIDGGSSTGKKKGVALGEDELIVAPDGDGGSHGKSVQSAVSSSESISPLHDGNRDVMEAMEEVKERFDEATSCGEEVSRLLEVGKVSHRTTPRVLRYFSSRVVDPISLTVPSTSCLPRRHRNSRSSSSKAPINSSTNGDVSLSSTLEKLCVWEKKLYQEVKDEEKLRILYEKKYRRLKYLDERGVEPNAIDSTRLSVQNLRSRITINIRTASAFSSKIEKIRDEELYPQLVDLIQELRRMWKAVLQCHEKQLLAINGSKIHLLKAMTISQSSAATMATLELERELAKWYRCFNKWISSQRSYVEALNGWLKKWFPEVQEQDTPDGAPPFSPGKLNALPIFIISNDWFQAIDLVPKNEALRSIDYFSKLVHEFKKSQEDEHRQKRKADHASRDYSRKREILQRELGLSTSLDMVTVMDNTHPSYDDRVIELQKMRKRRDDERARHDEIVKHVHLAVSATLPVGLVPMLEQIISFFQGNLRVYMRIRIRGT